MTTQLISVFLKNHKISTRHEINVSCKAGSTKKRLTQTTKLVLFALCVKKLQRTQDYWYFHAYFKHVSCAYKPGLATSFFLTAPSFLIALPSFY